MDKLLIDDRRNRFAPETVLGAQYTVHVHGARALENARILFILH